MTIHVPDLKEIIKSNHLVHFPQTATPSMDTAAALSFSNICLCSYGLSQRHAIIQNFDTPINYK